MFSDTLINLIRNAVEATPKKGTLTFVTREIFIRNTPGVEIVISDTGQGIPQDTLPKIFELFFTTKTQGLGLGLWRDRVFIKRLGGDIEVKSQVERGTTFVIKIPANAESINN